MPRARDGRKKGTEMRSQASERFGCHDRIGMPNGEEPGRRLDSRARGAASEEVRPIGAGVALLERIPEDGMGGSIDRRIPDDPAV